MPLGIGIQQISRSGDRHLFANAAHHILQRPAIGLVVMHIIGRQDRRAIGLRHPVEPLDPRRIVSPIQIARRDMAE